MEAGEKEELEKLLGRETVRKIERIPLSIARIEKMEKNSGERKAALHHFELGLSRISMRVLVKSAERAGLPELASVFSNYKKFDSDKCRGHFDSAPGPKVLDFLNRVNAGFGKLTLNYTEDYDLQSIVRHSTKLPSVRVASAVFGSKHAQLVQDMIIRKS